MKAIINAGMLAKTEGMRRRGQRRMASLTQWTMRLSKLREMVRNREAWRAAVHGVTKSGA